MAEEQDENSTPDWPEEFNAPISQLGPPLSVHRFTNTTLRKRLVIGLGGIILSVFANFVYWVVLGMRWVEKYLLIALFGPAIFGFASIAQSLRHRGLWVLRFPMGLLCWKRGEIHSFSWDEIESVVLLGYGATGDVIPFGISAADDSEAEAALPRVIPLASGAGNFGIVQMQLVRNDGTEFRLPSPLDDFVELGEQIQAEIYDRKWPALWDAFRAGQRVDFGDLGVTTGGLYGKKDFLPWQDFENATVVAGNITIKRLARKRAWLALPLKTIPNAHLLLCLLDRGKLPPSEG